MALTHIIASIGLALAAVATLAAAHAHIKLKQLYLVVGLLNKDKFEKIVNDLQSMAEGLNDDKK